MIVDYNSTKAEVDNTDKLIKKYPCARRTSRWPVRLFMNMLDTGDLNAFIIWMLKNNDWNSHQKNRRYRFLQELGNELIKPNILHKATNPNGLHLTVAREIKAVEIFKAHYQHPSGSKSRGEDVHTVLEENTRKSTQSAGMQTFCLWETQENNNNRDMWQ